MGYKGVINNTSPCSAQDMISIAGQDALEGFISTDVALGGTAGIPKILTILGAREKTEFGTSYGNTWDFYSQALILVAAMQRADVDPTVIKNILEAILPRCGLTKCLWVGRLPLVQVRPRRSTAI